MEAIETALIGLTWFLALMAGGAAAESVRTKEYKTIMYICFFGSILSGVLAVSI